MFLDRFSFMSLLLNIFDIFLGGGVNFGCFRKSWEIQKSKMAAVLKSNVNFPYSEWHFHSSNIRMSESGPYSTPPPPPPPSDHRRRKMPDPVWIEFRETNKRVGVRLGLNKPAHLRKASRMAWPETK